MSNPRATAPMRLGMVSILLLVIAFCLVVLSVLSLATARAGAVMSERQAANVRESYAVEATAQRFVAQLDEVLSGLRAGETPPDRILDAAARGAEGYIAARESQTNAWEPGITITVESLTAAEMHQTLGHVIADPPLGALQVQFAGPSGHTLDTLLAIEKDGTYSIMQWKASKSWEVNTQAAQTLRMRQ